jgi:LacI family transcriptional regulator
MSRPRRVALLIETSREYGRGLLRGLIRHQRERGPWSIYFRPRGLGELPPSWLRNWDGDGILARIDSPQVAEAVLASGLPAIDLRLGLPGLNLPTVGTDNRAIVELAVRHLFDRGFRQFGFCGLVRGDNIVVDFRGDCCARLVQELGGRCAIFEPRRSRKDAAAWEQEQSAIVSWLTDLPKPVGIMACHDDRGQQLLDACRRAGLRVPDEVAVIGVDNDEYLCNLSTPPLSSVDVGVERVGYEAGVLLDRLMSGEAVPERHIVLQPIGVVVRQSTDVMAIDDRELAELIRFIREHACEGIRVDDVLRRSTQSHSTLQRRFKALLGRTPKEEITRTQLERARHLLVHTDLPATDIAAKCGFSQLKRFSSVFHAKVGLPPGAYRQRARQAR